MIINGNGCKEILYDMRMNQTRKMMLTSFVILGIMSVAQLAIPSLIHNLVYANPDCSIGKNVKESLGTPRDGNIVGSLHHLSKERRDQSLKALMKHATPVMVHKFNSMFLLYNHSQYLMNFL